MILQDGNFYRIFANLNRIDELKPASYKLCLSQTGYYLEEFESLKLPEKLYGNDKDFINHVLNINSKTEESIGIGLVGAPGLGKSVTANVISKTLSLPVIYINKNYGTGMFDFLNMIKQKFVIYIDEFEKIFPQSKNDKNDDENVSQEDFLSFLDGSNSSNYKKVFIVTSNKELNIYLKNRPSRLRYIKEYKILSNETIDEIIKHKLVNREFDNDLKDNLIVEGLNIDILDKIIDEINLSGKPYSSFKSFFNYKTETRVYNIFLVQEGKEDLLINTRNLSHSAYFDLISEMQDNSIADIRRGTRGFEKVGPDYDKEGDNNDEVCYVNSYIVKELVEERTGSKIIKCDLRYLNSDWEEMHPSSEKILRIGSKSRILDIENIF